MSHLSLATKYRPQIFADVAGQPSAAIALSRAAKLDRVAPAYLLSGTRGVGKTTIARIFAKALNCETAPTDEPCNQCPQCRHITAGNHIDVSEIDGASNTGVDDVRALKETVGFMPMEGRYKIFIVDEAHMLSKSAFNALLKTLEEPPAHTVFIFATTEAHRFPATIISRCQHYVFRHLSNQAIFEHLVKILGKENITYEEAAIRMLARRAAGSVRDSLSLLDQTISLTNGSLDAESARQALGIAGPELFSRLFTAIAENNCAEIVALTENMLASGLDLAFFTRELSAHLRNLFLLRQAGEKILPTLVESGDERQFLLDHAPAFSTTHLHAAWQMALESQRAIAQSPAPGSALEMLLINLALLPQILPVNSPDLPTPAIRENSPGASSGGAEEPVKAYAASGKAPSSPAMEKTASTGHEEKSWDGFRQYCSHQPGNAGAPDFILAHLVCKWDKDSIEISAASQSLWDRLESCKNAMEKAFASYCGNDAPRIRYREPVKPRSAEEFREICEQKPEIKLCREILGANITACAEKPAGGI